MADVALTPEQTEEIGTALAKAGPELGKLIGSAAPAVLKTVQGIWAQSGKAFLDALDMLPIPKEAKAFFRGIVKDVQNKNPPATAGTGNRMQWIQANEQKVKIGLGLGGLALGIFLGLRLLK